MANIRSVNNRVGTAKNYYIYFICKLYIMTSYPDIEDENFNDKIKYLENLFIHVQLVLFPSRKLPRGPLAVELGLCSIPNLHLVLPSISSQPCMHFS